MVNKSLSDHDVQYILDAFFDAARVTKTTFFKMGAENTTALVEGSFGRVVLRVWGEQHSRMGARKLTDIQDELDFMEACRSQGLPIPAVHTSLAGHKSEQLPSGRIFTVMDYVAGEEPANFTPAMIEQLACVVATMNVLGQTYRYPAPRSFTGTIVDLAHERIEAYRQKGKTDDFVDYLAHKMERELAGIDLSALPFGPIHGDIMYQNIKYDGQKLTGIFDFDDCRESYFIEDITKTLLFAIEDPTHCVLGSNIENAKIFMLAYEQIRPLSEAEKAAWPALATARMVYELLKYYLHGATHPNAAHIIEAKKAAYQKFKPLFESGTIKA